MLPIYLVVALGLAGFHASEANLLNPDKYMEKAYDKIHKYLIETVPTDDVEANMAKAAEWLKIKAKNPRSSTAKALRKFLALQSVLSADMCNQAGYELLLANDMATGQRNHRWWFEPKDRIDILVRHYMLEHAKLCRPLYPSVVAYKKRSDLDPQHVAYVDTLTLLTRTTLPHRFFKWYAKCDEITPAGEAEVLKNLRAYETVLEHSKDDPDRGGLEKWADEERGVYCVDEAKVARLFNKYVYAPCKEFNDKIGADLFQAIKYDFDIRDGSEGTMECKDIMLNRIALGICHELVHNEQYREANLKYMIEKIKSR